MLRRSLVAGLWFMAAAFAGEILWSLGVTPRPIGLIVAAAVAGFVWLDPMGQLHPTRLGTPAVRSTIAPDTGLVPN